MRKYLLVGTGVALLAGGGVALAQMPPGMDRDGMERGGMDRMEGPEGMGEHGPGMMRGRWEMMHHPRPGGGGAAFRFRRGDMEISIRCSEREPTQACVNAASTLLDKLGSAPAPAAPPPPTAPRAP